MDDPTLPRNVITVLTVGMDARKLAVFRMAFRMHTIQRYQLVEDVPGTSPDVAIVDMDAVDAASLWQRFREEFPALPAIIVTVSPRHDAPAPVLAKPIRVETLFPLLRKVMAGEVAPPSPAAPPPKATPEKPAAKAEAPAAPPEAAPQTPPPPRPAHQLPEVIERFNPAQGLLGALLDVRRDRVPSVISLDGQAGIIVLPNQERALLLRDMAVVRQSCIDPRMPVTSRPLTAADRPGQSEPHSFTSLLWQVALWTSRGRLIDGIHAHTPVRLRHWPNLTRLAPVPEAMRIAALWVRSPVNLRLTVRMLNVPPQHIFDFLAASHSIGILDVSQAPVAAAPSPAEETIGAPPPDKGQSNLLSRLLRKVIGL